MPLRLGAIRGAHEVRHSFAKIPFGKADFPTNTEYFAKKRVLTVIGPWQRCLPKSQKQNHFWQLLKGSDAGQRRECPSLRPCGGAWRATRDATTCLPPARTTAALPTTFHLHRPCAHPT